MKNMDFLYKPNDTIPLWGAFKGDGLVVDLTVDRVTGEYCYVLDVVGTQNRLIVPVRELLRH
ncbi:hypothetical protein POHY109586_02075 [Polaromonas hydrogenivorans]